MTQDYSRDKGGAALAARLRRVSERLDRDGTRAYADRGIAFEQRWYGVLRQIVESGPLAIGEIAARLKITHVSVSTASRSLEKSGYVESLPDSHDSRRRLIALTDEGRRLVERLTPLWDAFNAAAEELNAEAGDVVRLLDRLDEALDAKSMLDRINAHFDSSD
jgi:DNA-binding MarR family transcriptional regulator